MLYDKTGAYGALGELYGIGAANLVSHFGSWTAKSVAAYVCGDIAKFSALIYLGSTYDEPLSTCFLDEVAASTKPVIWSFYNLWQLATRMGDVAFIAKYGFSSLGLDFSAVAEVRYKGRSSGPLRRQRRRRAQHLRGRRHQGHDARPGGAPRRDHVPLGHAQR